MAMFGFLLFIILLILILLTQSLVAFSVLLFGELLCLSIAKCANSVSRTRQLVNAVCDLASTDQGHDNAGAHNECQDEAIDSVPWRSPAPLGGATVCVVEEVEGDELGDQSVFNGEEDGGPCDCGGPDTNSITLVALVSTVTSELQTPVNGAEEGDDLRKESTN